MKTKIYKEEIVSIDPRLKRNINHDERSKSFAFNTSGLTIKSIKHTRHIGTLNQGSLGSCTGNAGIGDIATDPLFASLPKNLKYSLDQSGAIALYSAATEIDEFGGTYPPNDTGSSGLGIAKALKNAGVISGYQHTFTLEDALKAGQLYPFITGLKWYESMFKTDPDGRVHISGALSGGHEIQMIEIDAELGRIWFWNSWGDDWGITGKFYLTWTDFNSLLVDQGDVTILFPAEITPPSPAPIVEKLYKPKNFVLKELVSPIILNTYGDKAWEFLDERLLKNIQFIRDSLAKPIRVNNGTTYKNRCFDAVEERKTGTSQHNMGRAIDFDVVGMTAEQVRKWISDNYTKFPEPNIWIEKNTSWIHMDVRYSNNKGLYMFSE